MSKDQTPSLKEWFNNCGTLRARHDLNTLGRGIAAGMLNAQDEYGMTALGLAVMSGWKAGVEELLRAGAATELRYFRTGETALYMATQERKEPVIAALIAAGANPDAPNYWGITPRARAAHSGATWFNEIPVSDTPLPPPRIQNAEHLADHYHPKFEIPDREERETLQTGQAVDLYVYGPKKEGRQDTVKVRISATSDRRYAIRQLSKHPSTAPT